MMLFCKQNMDVLTVSSENLKQSVLSPNEIDYLREVDVMNDFETYQNRLNEIKELSCVNEKQILSLLDSLEREQYFSQEYEELCKQVSLEREDYQKIKDFSLDHNLDIKVNSGSLDLINEDKVVVVSLDSVQKTGEVLIGEHYYRRTENYYTNVQRGEFRLPGYEIKDTYNVYGPNSSLTGSIKVVEVNGTKYEIPIEEYINNKSKRGSIH